MTNIKVGDKVIRKKPSDAVWDVFCEVSKNKGGIHTVTGMSSSERWISVDNYSLPLGFYINPFPFRAEDFELVEDEETLPPVKEHELYLESGVSADQPLGTRQILEVYTKNKGLEISVGGYAGNFYQLFALEPNDALDLANDLIRMALHMKRQSEEE